MSIATWGEDPRGTWILDIFDEIGPEQNNGTIGVFTLILHGTTQIPAYRRNGPRIYNEEYNRIRKTYAMLEPSTNSIQNGYDHDLQSPGINDI
ncbi:Neuroendocrine convertase [Ooceraea biroi]|nr:Neuroendocrine convertase [Ooceraea biroi]